MQAYKDLLIILTALLALAGLVALLNLLAVGGEGAAGGRDGGAVDALMRRGQQAVQRCRPCHDLSPAQALDRPGPPLWGVYNRAAGAVEGFAYSDPFLQRECLVWNDHALDRYLKNPRAFLPGVDMTFAGERDVETRRDLIRYLRGLRPEEPQPLLTGEGPQEDSFDRYVDIGDVSGPLVDQGIEEAEKCAACHDLTETRKNLVGPALWGVVGRPAGRVPGFCYSDAFLRTTGQTLVWTERNLYLFLKNPPGFIPGTRMLFEGVHSDARRIGLIGFLRTLR